MENLVQVKKAWESRMQIRKKKKLFFLICSTVPEPIMSLDSESDFYTSVTLIYVCWPKSKNKQFHFESKRYYIFL